MMNNESQFRPDLIIEVTNACNMTCRGCYAPNIYIDDLEQNQTSVTELKVDNLKNNWPSDQLIETVSIRGGEPSLNSELSEILEFLKTKAKNIYLETNGTWILTNDKLLNSVAITKTKIKLSLDKMHRSNNSVFECWKKKLSEKGISLAIAITEFTFEDFEKVKIRFLKDFTGDIFWHQKTMKAEKLLAPKIGVINIHGNLQTSVSSKFKSTVLACNSLIIFFALFSFLQIVNAMQKVSIGIAANFSTMTDSTTNPYSNYFRNSINLAIEDNKYALQKKELEIEIREFDYGNDKVKAINAAKQAVESNVVAVLGYIYSSEVLLAGPIFEKNKLLLFTPTASADRIEELGRYVRRSCFSDSFQGQILADYAFKNKKIKTVAIISVSDCAYCQSLREAFKKQFLENGGIVRADISILSSDTSFSEVINKLKNQQIDAILIPNYEKISAAILSTLVDNKINPEYWLGGDGWGNLLNLFSKIVGSRKYKALTVTHWHISDKSPKSKAFTKAFFQKYKKNPIDSAVLAYDAASLLIHAILKAKLPINRENILEALESINSYEGVTGKIIYLPNKRTPLKPAVILSHDSGNFALETIVGN